MTQAATPPQEAMGTLRLELPVGSTYLLRFGVHHDQTGRPWATACARILSGPWVLWDRKLVHSNLNNYGSRMV